MLNTNVDQIKICEISIRHTRPTFSKIVGQIFEPFEMLCEKAPLGHGSKHLKTVTYLYSE
jgi:hypothetical protein